MSNNKRCQNGCHPGPQVGDIGNANIGWLCTVLRYSQRSISHRPPEWKLVQA